MEVEELRPVAPPFSKVVVGEIVEAAPHPDADRLRVCQVDVGHGRAAEHRLRRARTRAPASACRCALVGAELPPGDDGKPFEIKVGKLRGVESQGMLCSARELKLSDDHGGLLELAADAPVGADVRERAAARRHALHAQAHAQPGALPERLRRRARGRRADRRAAEDARVRRRASRTHDQRLPVSIEAPDLCGRFSGRVVRNVDTQAKTPAWMVERLARCGQRSVTALVDISNYVMFEFGRPSHIFDLDKIHERLDRALGRATASS